MLERLAARNPAFSPFLGEAEKLEEPDLDFMLSEVPAYDAVPSVRVEDLIPEAAYDQFRGVYHPYLKWRGITLDTAKAWESGWDDQDRVVTFPVRNAKKELLGVTGRFVKPRGKPYRIYWSRDRRSWLFGEQLVVPGTKLIVVEGVLDAVIVWQALGERRSEFSVVALLGVGFTNDQLDKLVSLADTAILFFDNDNPGAGGYKRMVEAIGRRIHLLFVPYPEGVKDPGDALQVLWDMLDKVELAY